MNSSVLSDVLAYDNNAVVQEFCLRHADISVADAQQIFKDLLAWLWLSEHRLQRQLHSHMIAPLAALDEMWHIFILRTRDYVEFCQQYFHRYLHHEAEQVGAEYHVTSDELTAYLEDCYEYLGEAWLARNFAEIISH